MADEERKKSAAPGPSRSTASSRAAQRRVTLPEGSRDAAASGSSGSRPVRVVRPPRPFWKKGGFWFGVIVAEAAVAVGLSFVFALDPDTLSLDGGDRTAFCDQVRQYQAEGIPGSEPLDLTNAGREYQHQASSFRKLALVAPDALRPDLEKVATLTEEIVATADEVVRRKQADPGYLEGMADISKKQGEVSGRAFPSIERIDKVILRACGININAPAVPTTTAVVTLPPITDGSTPGSTPGSTVAPTPG